MAFMDIACSLADGSALLVGALLWLNVHDNLRYVANQVFLASGAYGVSASSYCFDSYCCAFVEGGSRGVRPAAQ
jgi:hypothetical protein